MVNSRLLLFVDADYLVAIYNPLDKSSSKAQQIAKKISKRGNITLVTSNYVLLEAYTVLSQQAGKSPAIKLGTDVRKAGGILNVIHIDCQLNEECWKIFKDIKNKNVSFVDASTITLMKTNNICALLSFDKTDFNKSLQKRYNFTLFN